jgi:dTDP-4-amino-4,6-dideoxygalactose transaminase
MQISWHQGFTYMQKNNIPFNKPFFSGKELRYISEAVNSHCNISGNGLFTKKCHKCLESNLNIKKVLLTHSCTAALEMAAILAGIQPGDEIIMPSFTFVSTANAFVLRGGVPVFVDIRPDTLNIDESKIEAAITKKTRAIVPVHYAGVACEMDTIMDIALKYNLLVIEDAAQAILSEYKERKLGSIGHLGCLSFHETKNIISGEGGALLVNDERFIERAEIVWEKGTNRQQFFRGEVDKYTWTDIGSSYLPSDIIAAFLYAQLEHAEKITKKRSNDFNTYYRLLKPIEERGYIQLPYIPDYCKHNGHLFYTITRSHREQKNLLLYLNENGINAVFHYIPLHSSPAGIKYGRSSENLEATSNTCSRLIRLPLFYELTIKEIYSIVRIIYSYFDT